MGVAAHLVRAQHRKKSAAVMKWTPASLCLVGLFCSLASSVRVVKLGGKDCEFDGGRICNGAVTKEIGSKLLKVCSDGKIKTKTRKSVGEGYPLVGRDTGDGKDCVWYGTTFCDGDVVEDLYRWWFKMRCSTPGSAWTAPPGQRSSNGSRRKESRD